MNAPVRFLRKRRLLSIVGGGLLALALLAGAAVLHARGGFDAEVFSDLPENEGKLRAASLPANAPGSEGPGRSPTFLVLGSTHLSQDDDSVGATERKRVTDALSEFRPDMLVVEELPPSWPRGRGRDYRPDFEMERYATEWAISSERAAAVIDSLGERKALSERERCRLGKAYFLTWDLANAAYQWTGAECPVTGEDDELARWFDDELEGEMVQIGFPVARANGVKRVVPFDYQGDDAGWFLGRQMKELIDRRAFLDLLDYWPAIRARYTGRAYRPDETAGLAAMLRYLNSPEWLALQYWAYEQTLVDIAHENAGPRQVENYWLRNRKMFGEVEDAIQRRDPDRVMIVVGAGHKYFLDLLVRESGYRWVDPRDYLPQS